MGYLMEGYTRNARGGISNRRFDSDQFPGPGEGWYDSPDKVPLLPGQTAEPEQQEPRVSKGEGIVLAGSSRSEMSKAISAKIPRVNGRFVKRR
jgi:hypothetical protein